MDEKRYTPEQYKAELIKWQKSRPVVMDETEYANELDQTVILRYQRGIDLLDGVSDHLRSTLQDKALSESLIQNIESAITAFSYGHIGHNRCGRANKGAHARAILWYDPEKEE